jgi:hypothetical protein
MKRRIKYEKEDENKGINKLGKGRGKMRGKLSV